MQYIHGGDIQRFHGMCYHAQKKKKQKDAIIVSFSNEEDSSGMPQDEEPIMNFL